jgi:branched-chain amino acid aminotransferase
MNVLLDGTRLAAPAQARLSPLNTALLFGESLYETLPVYFGRPFALKEHLERLEKGCRFLNWPLPDPKVFERAVRLLAGRMEPPRHFAVRFSLVQEVDPPGKPRSFSGKPPRLFAAARPLGHRPETFWPPVGRVGIAKWRAPSPGVFPAGFKGFPAMMVRRDWRLHPDWDEMLRLDERGMVVDGGGASPLWFLQGSLLVPPRKGGGLESVTRNKIIGFCRFLGVKVREKEWTPAEVQKKGELFFAGSGVGVLGVARIGARSCSRPPLAALRFWQFYRREALQGR